MAWASKLANHNDITGPEGGNALRFFLFFKKILIFDNYAGLLVTGTRGAIVVIEGRRVTLFPNFKSSEQEQRLVSMLLRVMELVPSFANDLLRPIGVSVSRTASTKYLAEVTLSQESKLRPDGFIRIRDWKAIVEAKTGNNKVDDSQIKNYINLVRGTPINAIITISNEMVANPQFHPSTTLSKIERRTLHLFHFSWQHIFTQLCLWADEKDEVDLEQSAILSDFMLFLENSDSGMRRFDRMGSSWRLLLDEIRMLPSSENMNPQSPHLEAVVNDWFFEEHDLCLKLSEKLKTRVKVKIPRKLLKGNFFLERMRTEKRNFISSLCLRTTFVIPNAADQLFVEANLKQRKTQILMQLEANENYATTRGRVGWLKKTLKTVDRTHHERVFISLHWSQASQNVRYSLQDFLELKEFADPRSGKPVARFKIQMVTDNASSFYSPRNFILSLEKLVFEFYEHVGEKLKKWNPNPPKVVNGHHQRIDHDDT